MAIDWKKNSGTDFNVTLNNAILSHNFSTSVLSFHTIAVIVYTISVLVSAGDHVEIDISMRPLILKMSFPFHSDSSLIYGITLVAQFFYLLFCSIGVSMLNALLIVLVSQLKSRNINYLERSRFCFKYLEPICIKQ
jgi:hypothetical protein